MIAREESSLQVAKSTARTGADNPAASRATKPEPEAMPACERPLHAAGTAESHSGAPPRRQLNAHESGVAMHAFTRDGVRGTLAIERPRMLSYNSATTSCSCPSILLQRHSVKQTKRFLHTI